MNRQIEMKNILQYDISNCSWDKLMCNFVCLPTVRVVSRQKSLILQHKRRGKIRKKGGKGEGRKRSGKGRAGVSNCSYVTN